MPKGSASGPSGWNYEHLKVLIERDTTAESLFSLCDLLAKGHIPDGAAKLLSASCLVALNKPNGDVRPIAIGECIRRLTAKTICAQKRESLATFFTPLQHGVALKGGSELLFHHISLLLESNRDWVMLKTDIKNAFNTVERAHLLSEVAKSFPDIYLHVYQMYSRSGPLIFRNGNDVHVLSSQEGIHQGDPLGPILFSLALHPILLDLQSKHTTIQVLAYLDDMFLIGPLEDVLSALDDAQSNLSHIGLTIAPEKCEIYGECTTNSFKAHQHIPIAQSGTKVLGTPIGQPDYVREACLDIAKLGQSLCDQLVSLNDPQCGMLLLRYCHASRINHLARSVFPSHFLPAANFHDRLTKSTFERLIKCYNIEEGQLMATGFFTHPKWRLWITICFRHMQDIIHIQLG